MSGSCIQRCAHSSLVTRFARDPPCGHAFPYICIHFGRARTSPSLISLLATDSFSYHAEHHTMALSNPSCIQSPRTSLIPFISTEDVDTMAYPPNALPGARNVQTFYGTMRVYEWGPEGGDRVLFIHGDTTPSPIFSKIAQGLVDTGHRVMLFGRQRNWIYCYVRLH